MRWCGLVGIIVFKFRKGDFVAGNDFLEEQRRRQRELVAARRARQNPELAPKVAPVEPLVPKTFGDKVKNFWFHYKYFVLAGVFLATVLSVAITQCATREKFDTEVVLFTYNNYTAGQLDALELELEKHAEDLNGDGEVNVQIIDCAYGNSELLDQQNAKRTKLTAVIASNSNALLYITDAKSFEYLDTLFDDGFFVDLELPNNDGKSLALNKAFYDSVNSKSEVGFKLPEGLQISRRVAGENTIVGQNKDIKIQMEAADKILKAMTK